MEINQFEYVLGEDLTAGTLVFIWTDGKLYSSYADGYEVIGVLQYDAVAGEKVQVLTGVFEFESDSARKGPAYLNSDEKITSNMSDKFIGKVLCVVDSKAIVLIGG